MVALANSAAVPAPRMLATEELVKLVEKMCAAKGPQKDKLLVRIMEGYFGRHMLPEELQPRPFSQEEQQRLEREWIAKIRSGEARKIK
jgi:hypothetical protein